MVAHVITAALIGLDVHLIDVEADKNMSLPSVAIVGLPDMAVSEAKERVRAAIKNSGYTFPNQKVVINLAPGDIKKEGTHFDLAMAVGILARDEVIKVPDDTAFLGELSLDGNLREINGILPLVSGLKNKGVEKVVVPFKNAKEAGLVEGIVVLGANNLMEVVNHFCDISKLEIVKSDVGEYLKDDEADYAFDFKDVKGQLKAKRALEIAAAGSHNVLMAGSPGSGKTLLAKCFPSILPPLDSKEAFELTKIYSVCGLVDREKPLVSRRPFRVVHHKASAVGIIGGGSNPKPGEITLAHRGVLFMDEMIEFPREVLEVLRQPLEDGYVTISRAQTSVKYPADFMLLGAMNPCPCGFLGDSKKLCTCNPFQIQRYRSKISGPLLDRIDMQIDVARLSQEELMSYTKEGEASASIRQRVVRARIFQAQRYKNEGILTNNELGPRQIKKFCKIDEETKAILKCAVERFSLSARAHDRVLKLARTIADLNESEKIKIDHLAEALQYRGFKEETY